MRRLILSLIALLPLSSAALAAAPPAPAIVFYQVQLGNIFSPGEKVQIAFTTPGERVTWTVNDAWHEPVAEGKGSVRSGKFLLEPHIDHKGYFDVHVIAFKGDQKLAEGNTAIAVIAAADNSKTDNSPFGVNTYFADGWDLDVMPLIAKAGIKIIRDRHPWANTEKKNGEYTFDPRYEAYMKDAARLKLDPLFVMGFENDLYDGGQTPCDAVGNLAFAKYGQAVLQHYGKLIKYVEVWDEYNGAVCKGPATQDRPKFYAAMLKTVYDRIKSDRPDVTVLGGASLLLPPAYFEAMFKNGAMASMDGVVFHPFRPKPEGIETEVAALQAMIRKFDRGADKPLWITATADRDDSPDGRANTARYLVKQYTLLLSQNAKAICWFLARDYNNSGTMGLLHDAKDPMGKYVASPAYVAYANLIAQLSGQKIVARQATEPGIYIETFSRNGQLVNVCWAAAPVSLALQTPAPVTVVDMMGAEQTLSPSQGQIYVALSDSPIYLKGPAAVKISDKPRFSLTADPSTSPLDPISLHFTYDNVGQSTDVDGAIDALGERYAFKCPANQRSEGTAVLHPADTSHTGPRYVSYRLELDGKPAGTGSVTVNVIDPLRLEPPTLADARRLQFKLANSAGQTPFAVQTVEWTAGKSHQVQTVNANLAAGTRLVVDLPLAAALAPYGDLAVDLTVTLKGHDPLTSHSVVVDDPCPYGPIQKRAPALQLAGKIAGQAWMGWDDRNLYLAVKSGEPSFKFGVAPAVVSEDDIRRDWYEFEVGRDVRCTISPGDALKGAVRSIAMQGQGDLRQLTIPWSTVAALQPGQGAIRLSIATATTAWGGGINGGKSPAAYRLCRLAAAASPTTNPAFSTAAEPLAAKPIEHPGGRLIADSQRDFDAVQGKNNWSYGYYDGTGGAGRGGITGPYTADDFKPMQFDRSPAGEHWGVPGVRYLSFTANAGHPGAAKGVALWSVRRWTSPLAGRVRVSGKLSRLTTIGDGVGAIVLVDGAIVHSAILLAKDGATDASFDLTQTVKPGTTIDFALTPGPASDVAYDTTAMRFSIEQLAASTP